MSSPYELEEFDDDEDCACEIMNVSRIPRTYEQIQSAARSSCGICGAFVKVIEAVVDGCLPEVFRGPRDEAERTRILGDLVVEEVNLEYMHDGSQMTMSIMGRRVTIYLFRDRNEQAEFRLRGKKIFPGGRPLLGPTTASEQGFNRARGWLRQCLKYHDCETQARGSDANRQPKRLLDLRGDRIRLFETDTSDVRFEAPYVCLSHRWGDAQHRRLTSTVNTIHQHFQGILWDDLPRTFQDAVTICRRMSVEYLWIDSLCILQEFQGMTDDEAKQTKTDFAQENSMMATIYRNSYFTISADMSTSMTSGIFCARSCESHRIQVKDDDGIEVFFHIRESKSHSTTTDLETRGWTFQEYVLPARVLGFGQFDISWRCRHNHTCECEGITSTSNQPWRLILGEETRPKKHPEYYLPDWWQWMVSFYSSRKLTNEQDKLPALSGVAQIYNEATLMNDTYLGGLWQTFLHRGLCWYHVKNSDSYREGRIVEYPVEIGVGRRPQGFRAPSWSWASLDACDDSFCCPWFLRGNGILTGYGGYSRQNACTIYEAVCKPKTKDAFGEVEPGAFINIETKLISATIATAPDTDPEADLTESERRKVCGLLPWTLSLAEDDREVTICFPDCRLEDDGLKLGDAVYCAPILEELTICESQIACLVLKCLQGQQYRRVGFCLLGKRNPQFAQYSRQEIDNITNFGYNTLDLSKAENVDSVREHALQYSQEAEVRITII